MSLKKLPSSDYSDDECTARTSVSTFASDRCNSVTGSDRRWGGKGNAHDRATALFPYEPTESPVAKEALESLRERLSDRLKTTTGGAAGSGTLRLVSMKECFSMRILTQFYEELMIPNFPLDEERDDLDDWLYYLDPSDTSPGFDMSDYPSMDVLILCHTADDENNTTTIIGGIAFEYYPLCQLGLLSYMVVSDQFRRLGILATLHPVFCEALQALHQHSGQTNTKIRAIVAETNTTNAGDVPPEEIRKRHEILYRLGYRLLEFPYVQPPLATDVQSFDEIMLLVFLGSVTDTDASPSEQEAAEGAVGDKKINNQASAIRTKCGSLQTQVLFQFVLEFYHSVFGRESNQFQDHWYYRLVTWYAPRNPITKIQMDLPWVDVTPKLLQEMEQDELQHQNIDEENSSISIKCTQ